jgi:hypothetical protein
MIVNYLEKCLTIGSDKGIKEIIEDLKKMILFLRFKKKIKPVWAATSRLIKKMGLHGSYSQFNQQFETKIWGRGNGQEGS